MISGQPVWEAWHRPAQQEQPLDGGHQTNLILSWESNSRRECCWCINCAFYFLYSNALLSGSYRPWWHHLSKRLTERPRAGKQLAQEYACHAQTKQSTAHSLPTPTSAIGSVLWPLVPGPNHPDPGFTQLGTALRPQACWNYPNQPALSLLTHLALSFLHTPPNRLLPTVLPSFLCPWPTPMLPCMSCVGRCVSFS